MKVCSVFDQLKNEPVSDKKGPIKFKVFMFKYLSTTFKGWQMNLVCFLNGITQDFKWQSYHGIISWGRWEGMFFVGIAPGSTIYTIWPIPIKAIRDWIAHQGQQLINEIKNDILWIRGVR